MVAGGGAAICFDIKYPSIKTGLVAIRAGVTRLWRNPAPPAPDPHAPLKQIETLKAVSSLSPEQQARRKVAEGALIGQALAAPEKQPPPGDPPPLPESQAARRELAAIPGGGATWAQVADAWEAIAADGVLAPADLLQPELARRNAGRWRPVRASSAPPSRCR